MTKTSRSSVIGIRVSAETRTRFAALAARHQLTEAGLLAKLVDEVLRTNAPTTVSSSTHAPRASDTGRLSEDRITLRLRADDRALIADRAEARGMKPGNYLAMLIHNHLHGPVVLPPEELNQIEATCAQLAALGRQFRMFGLPNTATQPQASEIIDALALARREIEQARRATAAIVQRNLVSWETRGREVDHA
ncbi:MULTISPECIES: hypothetical protein [unclassified Variovorax]|uniref:hypothetical protein n=1 Tax=Variovorax TaxID=34072 RepID=UPI001F0CC37B|nr:hypothetical protein [Variovorax sp. 369]